MTQLSIGITAHSEGIILHKTLLSVQEAIAPLSQAGIPFEVLLQLDNPSEDTLEYSTRINDLFPHMLVRVFRSTYGNPGQARNNLVTKAKGDFITFLDGDDLVSSNWFFNALTFLSHHEGHVAHPEIVLEFGAENSIVQRHGEINQATDSLLSVYANRWNVVLMVTRSFLIDNPYPHGKGYGFEDWYINCLTIYSGLHNTLIPNTALFVRRKTSNSMWAEHKSNAAVLPHNPLLSFSYVRKLPVLESETIKPSSLKEEIKGKIKPIAKKVPSLRRAAHLSKKILGKLRVTPDQPVPAWIRHEYQHQHVIDKSIFFTSLTPYNSLTPEHYQAARSYKKIVDSLTRDTYDYLLFVPWLIKGGADLFAINYANAITAAEPSKNVLVIATTPSTSPWEDKLDSTVDFLDFGTITDGDSPAVVQRLLEQIIENSRAEYIHILNSELAYNFVETHAEYIRSTNKKVIATSFSQSTDESGRIFGYSHTHVPKIYDLLSLVTTDNLAVKDMWIHEYGFMPSKILVHKQPVILPKYTRNPVHTPLRVLWAARLSPEKQPSIVLEIAAQLQSLPIEIHMYGQADKGFDTSFLENLPKNVTYHGPFDGFSALTPEEFDIYLYTSLFDGMPNSILEAASYGLAIIASAIGGIPELIKDGQDGLLINDIKNPTSYASLLKDVLENPDTIKRFGDAIRSKIKEQFSEKSHRTAINNMLKEVGYSNDVKKP